MKRQRGVNVNGVKPTNPIKVEDVAAMGKKKAKKEAEKKGGKSVKEEEEEEERTESREVGGLLQGTRDSVMSWCWDEYMPPWLGGGVVDEQMSWGSSWYPGWDMDFMGEAFSSLYSDVVWDDDIWNFKKEIPIPLDRKRFDWG